MSYRAPGKPALALDTSLNDVVSPPSMPPTIRAETPAFGKDLFALESSASPMISTDTALTGGTLGSSLPSHTLRATATPAPATNTNASFMEPSAPLDLGGPRMSSPLEVQEEDEGGSDIMEGPVEAPIAVEDYAATVEEDKELLETLETGKGIDGSANWQAIKSDTMLLIDAAIWIEQGGGVDGFELPATSRKNIKQAPAKIGDNGITASAASYMAYVLRMKGSEHVGPYASQKMVKNKWTALCKIYKAIKTIGFSGSGLPFPYDEEHGFGLVQGDMGRELDNLMRGDSIGAKYNQSMTSVGVSKNAKICRPFRNAPWAYWKKMQYLFGDVRQEGSKKPRAELRNVVQQLMTGNDDTVDRHDMDNDDIDSGDHGTEDGLSEHERQQKRKAKRESTSTAPAKKKTRVNQSRETANKLQESISNLKEDLSSMTSTYQQSLEDRKAKASEKEERRAERERLREERAAKLESHLEEELSHRRQEKEYQGHKDRREALSLLSSAPLYQKLDESQRMFLVEYARQGDNAAELLEYAAMPDMWIRKIIQRHGAGQHRREQGASSWATVSGHQVQPQIQSSLPLGQPDQRGSL